MVRTRCLLLLLATLAQCEAVGEAVGETLVISSSGIAARVHGEVLGEYEYETTIARYDDYWKQKDDLVNGSDIWLFYHEVNEAWYVDEALRRPCPLWCYNGSPPQEGWEVKVGKEWKEDTTLKVVIGKGNFCKAVEIRSTISNKYLNRVTGFFNTTHFWSLGRPIYFGYDSEEGVYMRVTNVDQPAWRVTNLKVNEQTSVYLDSSYSGSDPSQADWVYCNQRRCQGDWRTGGWLGGRDGFRVVCVA